MCHRWAHFLILKSYILFYLWCKPWAMNSENYSCLRGIHCRESGTTHLRIYHSKINRSTSTTANFRPVRFLTVGKRTILAHYFIFVKNRFNGVVGAKFTPLSKIDYERIEYCMFPRIISTAQIRETETVNGRSRRPTDHNGGTLTLITS